MRLATLLRFAVVGAGATVVRSLSAKSTVTVLESRDGWSLIASDGKPIGYVATRALAPAQ